MVDLVFAAEGVEAERCAAVPTLIFKLRITSLTPGADVRNVLLQCQLRIDAARRRYDLADEEDLAELFGEPSRWRETLGSMLWTHVTLQVPAFEGESSVDLPVPCSFDFNVAATKYFHGVKGGEVPLSLLFSGTIFYRDVNGSLQMDPIPWSKQADFRLPVSVWRTMMDLYYPNSAWLHIDREVFEELHRFKRENGFTGWDHALRALLRTQLAEGVT
jgi:hypothetical protein